MSSFSRGIGVSDIYLELFDQFNELFYPYSRSPKKDYFSKALERYGLDKISLKTEVLGLICTN